MTNIEWWLLTLYAWIGIPYMFIVIDNIITGEHNVR